MSQLLLIDMGNSNIVIGRIRDIELDIHPDFDAPFLDRILTDRRMNVEDYCQRFQDILAKHNIGPEDISGCILSSTVPVLTEIVKKALELIMHVPVINLTGELDIGMKILRENPGSLGADIIAGAVGAIKLFGSPVIVADLGTCSTLAVVDDNGSYAGGLIMPGVKTSLDGMQANAPHLPEILYDTPESVISTDTIKCIQSGLLYGHACAIEGLIRRMWEELGYETKVVATGGFCKRVMRETKLDYIYERDLIFKGLAIIYLRLMGR